jgi:hypothetical protein
MQIYFVPDFDSPLLAADLLLLFLTCFALTPPSGAPLTVVSGPPVMNWACATELVPTRAAQHAAINTDFMTFLR